MKNKTLVPRLINHGFNETYIQDGFVYVVCSQCEALVVNGIAIHEHGCPNAYPEHEGEGDDV